jgi:hypothetical protein
MDSKEQDLREAFEAHIRKTWKDQVKYLDWALTMKDGQYQDSHLADIFAGWVYAAAQPQQPARWMPINVDALAQEIRRVDGNHSLGAGALAEALMPFLTAAHPSQQEDGARKAEIFDWLETELSAIDCRYRGDPSYDHDAYWMRQRVQKLIAEARTVFGSDSAGEADEEAKCPGCGKRGTPNGNDGKYRCGSGLYGGCTR